MKIDETSNEKQIMADYDEGTPVELERPKTDSTVLSVRMPRDLLADLSKRARALQTPVGRLARKYLEDGVARDAAIGPSSQAALFGSPVPAVGVQPVLLTMVGFSVEKVKRQLENRATIHQLIPANHETIRSLHGNNVKSAQREARLMVASNVR